MDTSFKPCSVENCTRNASREGGGTSGMCRPHYKKMLRYGNPLHVFERPDSKTLTWLKAHVNFSGAECLIWPFCRSKQGYGMLYATGSSRLAHRAMCVMKHGDPKIESLDVAHSCGNGHLGCVNPSHLRWDTRSGNFKDKLDHGTDNRGENSPVAKLSASDVVEIKKLRGKVKQNDLAARYGVCQSNISKIQTNVSWSY